MKRMKNVLRLWMASVSLGGFLGGWVLLAHAPKPASTTSSSSSSPVLAPVPTLTPLPPLSANIGGSQVSHAAPAMPSFQTQTFLPMLRTHGS
jgi:hypothetical protein